MLPIGLNVMVLVNLLLLQIHDNIFISDMWIEYK